jgi:hypothetical protein
VDKKYQDRLTIRKKENEMLHKNTLKSHWAHKATFIILGHPLRSAAQCLLKAKETNK